MEEDPYRSGAFLCPSCQTQPPLREFQNRLVCDECHRMLMTETDFASACADLAVRDITLKFTDETPTKIPCPSCARPMSSCKVHLEGLRVKTAIHRCDRDGIWLGSDVLASVFALIGRRVGGVGGPYYGASRSIGLDGLPIAHYRFATSGLRISDWKNRPRRRTPTVTPLNVYRDAKLPCPACKTDLRFAADRWSCDACAGCFMQNAALESMVLDMSGAPWSMPLATGQLGERACPVCSQAMIVEDIERVPIDRCTLHGIWFDARELAIALENASHEFEAHGVRGWLKKLFKSD